MKTEELLKGIEDAMTEEERKLHNKVHTIKHLCMSRVESLFVQHFHDAGIDYVPELVESFDKTDFSTIDERTDDLIFDLVTNFKFYTNHKGQIQMSKSFDKFSMVSDE